MLLHCLIALTNNTNISVNVFLSAVIHFASVEFVCAYFFVVRSVIALSLLLSAVRSVSFAGSVQRGETSWMGEDVKFPMRGLGLSSLCLQEKKGVGLSPAQLCISVFDPAIAFYVLTVDHCSSSSSGGCGQCSGRSHFGPVQFFSDYSSEGQSLLNLHHYG